MKHWELEINGEHIRAEWNESATFNIQTPIGGQWVDYHCFTVYGIESEQEALEYIMQEIQEQLEEDTSLWEEEALEL
jgi:hypothetical protein